ncbi:MAG TPA: carboxypeptidase regulatory-like domain-containing protein, partial [Pirellulales bacterium]|nr:carboxypeptidase regulatory-like domain-containing protein [Pirellulales bacterium]
MNQRSPWVVHLSLLAASLFAASRVGAETPDDGRVATVAGLVRDSETQEPLEGVEIVLTTGRGEARVRSDARGEFEARLAPGLLTCEVTDATKGHAAPWRAFRAPIEVTSADGPQTLPPIDLEPGRNVQGVVVDENDQPVAGAKVQAIWRASSRWLETSAAAPRLAATASDAKGEFRLSVVRPSGQPAMFWQGPWLMASIDGAATVRPEAIGPDTKEPVRLRLEPGGSVSIAGRAVDSTGQPLARAAVEIWIQWQNRGVAYFSSPLASAGQDELRTDDERRFRTIRRFSREAEYAVRFRADGFMPGMSRYAHAGGEATLTLGEVSLTRLRVIRGRVVDRQGRPVAGVRVFQSGDGPARTEATTGADGRFAVEGVVEGPAFLFVEKDGFRFHGQLVEPGRQDADLMIRRTNEPPEPLPRPQAMAREEELELARRAYRPLLDEGFADRDVQARFMILRNWSRLNPVAALESLDQGALADGGEGFHEALRGQIANALSLTEPDDAVAVAESIKGNAERAYAMVVLAGKLPASRREVKLDLLEQAVPFVRASDRPGLRAIWLECIADGLLDLGESRRATAVLDEARVLAASLPKAGPGSVERACVAEVVARVDLEGALELSEGLPEFPRYGDVHGKIAFRIAGRLPADAERVLELCRDSFQRDMFIPRVCWRMAPADPRRARMLAEKIRSPHLRPHALGLMAMALAETDAEQA